MKKIMKTLLKIWLILYLSVIVSCASDQPRPKPEICIHRANIKKMVCYDPNTQIHRKLNGDKYVCLSPDNFKKSLYFLKGLYKEKSK